MIFLCLSPEERMGWDDLNENARQLRVGAALPCADCTPEFAAEMYAKHRCNGFPGMSVIPKGGRQGPDMTVLRARVASLEEGAGALKARMASLEVALTVPPQERRRAQWRDYKARVKARTAGPPCPCSPP